MVLNDGYRNSNGIIVSKGMLHSYFSLTPFIDFSFENEQIINKSIRCEITCKFSRQI